MDQIQSILDGFIDFEGQRLAETLTTSILIFAGVTFPPSSPLGDSLPAANADLQVAAFVVGYVLSDLKYTVYIGLSGTAIAFLAVVPPWGVYKRKPLTWLPVGGVPVHMVDAGGQRETKKGK